MLYASKHTMSQCNCSVCMCMRLCASAVLYSTMCLLRSYYIRSGLSWLQVYSRSRLLQPPLINSVTAAQQACCLVTAALTAACEPNRGLFCAAGVCTALLCALRLGLTTTASAATATQQQQQAAAPVLALTSNGAGAPIQLTAADVSRHLHSQQPPHRRRRRQHGSSSGSSSGSSDSSSSSSGASTPARLAAASHATAAGSAAAVSTSDSGSTRSHRRPSHCSTSGTAGATATATGAAAALPLLASAAEEGTALVDAALRAVAGLARDAQCRTELGAAGGAQLLCDALRALLGTAVTDAPTAVTDAAAAAAGAATTSTDSGIARAAPLVHCLRLVADCYMYTLCTSQHCDST
jgi:hypothetical protein